MGRIKNNPSALVDPPKLREKEILVLTEEHQEAIRENIESGQGKTQREQKFHEQTKFRDMAIISLFLGTGIRVSELVGINLNDLDMNGQQLLVFRKGGKRQILYFNSSVAGDLTDYMQLERPALLKKSGENPKEKEEDGPLFLSLRGTRITTRRVEQLIKEYSRFVLPANMKVTPHTLRKTFGTDLYIKYRDLALVQNALGHASPNTTARYYAKFDEKLLQAMKNDN